jgi:hypothetical protein
VANCTGVHQDKKYLPPDRHGGAVTTAEVYYVGSHGGNGTAPEEPWEVVTGYVDGSYSYIGTECTGRNCVAKTAGVGVEYIIFIFIYLFINRVRPI